VQESLRARDRELKAGAKDRARAKGREGLRGRVGDDRVEPPVQCFFYLDDVPF